MVGQETQFPFRGVILTTDLQVVDTRCAKVEHLPRKRLWSSQRRSSACGIWSLLGVVLGRCHDTSQPLEFTLRTTTSECGSRVVRICLRSRLVKSHSHPIPYIKWLSCCIVFGCFDNIIYDGGTSVVRSASPLCQTTPPKIAAPMICALETETDNASLYDINVVGLINPNVMPAPSSIRGW